MSTPEEDELTEAAVALFKTIKTGLAAQDLYQYTLFLAQGGPFKITSLGNKVDWDPAVLGKQPRLRERAPARVQQAAHVG